MRRIDTIEPFRVMELLEAAQQLEAAGKSIIHMEIGEPDFPTPIEVISQAQRDLADRSLSYTASTGLPALQEALSAWYKNEYDVDVPPHRILITPGTSGAFSLLYAVLLEAGESVLLPDPGYPCQRNFIRLAGADPINVPVTADSRYHLSADLIDTYWRPSTQAAVLINPSNPTGTVVDINFIKSLAQACAQHGGTLISDEIYHGLTYGLKAPSALQVSDDVIVVNGFSKRWAMTGWRLGWVVVPEALVEPCRRVMQNIFIAAPTLSQYAGVTALQLNEPLEVMRKAYDERRRYLLSELPKLGFEITVQPEGAFYIYANVAKLTNDSTSFCWDVLNQVGVAITPGADFGVNQPNLHVRFSYATGLQQLKEAVRRLEKYLSAP